MRYKLVLSFAMISGVVAGVCSPLYQLAAQPGVETAPVANGQAAVDVRKRIPWLDRALNSALAAFERQNSVENLDLVFAALPSESRQGTKRYILEGDLSATPEEVCNWVRALTARPLPESANCGAQPVVTSSNTGLNSNERKELRTIYSKGCGAGGQTLAPCIWSTAERERLTYSIVRTSFQNGNVSAQEFSDFETSFKDAIAAWNELCAFRICGLRIMRDDTKTRSASEPLHFDVMYDATFNDSDSDCRNAQAYFRYQVDPDDHMIRVGARFIKQHRGVNFPQDCQAPAVAWTISWAHTLKHEIGHVLGYGHEQLAQTDVRRCTIGLGGSFDVNPTYDPQSVMHSSGCATADSMFKIDGNFSPQDKRQHTKYHRLNP